jgi:hypothetical protein
MRVSSNNRRCSPLHPTTTDADKGEPWSAALRPVCLHPIGAPRVTSRPEIRRAAAALGRTPRRSRPAGHRCRRRAGASRTSPQGFAGEVRPRRGILVPVGGDRRSALRGGTDPHVPHRPRTPPLRVDGLGPTHSTDAALLFGGLDKIERWLAATAPSSTICERT